MKAQRLLLLSISIMLSGCSRQHCERFTPVGDGSALALDRETGRQCYTLPKTSDIVSQVNESKGVFCIDLIEK